MVLHYFSTSDISYNTSVNESGGPTECSIFFEFLKQISNLLIYKHVLTQIFFWSPMSTDHIANIWWQVNTLFVIEMRSLVVSHRSLSIFCCSKRGKSLGLCINRCTHPYLLQDSSFKVITSQSRKCGYKNDPSAL
jgi:hypothetical protein